MRIPQYLPQFTDRAALLVVAGRKSANVYFALNGKIERVEHVKAERLLYEDYEGFSWTTVMSGVTGVRGRASSGAKHEPQDEVRVKKFEHALGRVLWRQARRNPVEDIYLFTPKTRELVGMLHPDLRQKVRLEIQGEFMHEHLIVLLERLERALMGRTVKPGPPSYVRRFLARTGIARLMNTRKPPSRRPT